MSLDEAIDTLRLAAKHDPVALLACCLATVIWYRRYKPADLPMALKLYAVVAELAAT